MFSVSSQIIMSAVALYLLTGSAAIMANVDTGADWTDWFWGAGLCFILFAVEDTVFYWTHRAMHHPRLFAAFHRVHHESVDPTPFTAFSFHPLEAAVQGMNGLAILAVLMLLPWHPVALAVFGIGQIAFNVIGHLGYEVYPKTWNRIPLLRWKTPALHHYQHHQNVGGNYALYFRWWDTICGTEFRDFEARYDRIFDASTSTLSRPYLHESSTKPNDSVASRE